MNSQHRRGGKHAVKDADLTHTKYDDYSREQLLAAVKEAGCYVKDEKKSVMARKLADNDRSMKREEMRAMRERKEKEEQQQQDIQEAAKARNIRRVARRKRNRERNSRREDGEDVSSNSDDTEDLHERDRIHAHKLTVTGGEALSDVTWEDTCSETTVRSVNPRVTPGCRLRLFEWPYLTMPSAHPPEDARFELFPRALTYAPLKLNTMHTHEKIILPGSKYPAGVEPDFVPILDTLTRTAARRGRTISLLSRAIIERATSWADRTIVSGWNGRMYFTLRPPSTTDLPLDTVFSKRNNEIAKLLQPTPRATDLKHDRKLRASPRLSNKRKRTTEMYEASKWRPLALAYMPAYLDWEQDLEYESPEDGEHTLEKLFFIRFPGCDLPHYYFWARKGGWEDPTIQDPSWNLDGQPELRNGPERREDDPPTRVRVRNGMVLTEGNLWVEPHELTLESVEHGLITYGLQATLAKARRFALSVEKEHEWNVFTHRLATLFPSGELPCVPPLQGVGRPCLAEKIIALFGGQDVQPYNGEEAWTRVDDDFWDVFSRPSSSAASTLDNENILASDDGSLDSPQPLSSSPSSSSNEGEDQDTAAPLHRRDSFEAPFPHHHHSSTPTIRVAKDPRILSWLAAQPPIFPPIILPLSSPRAPHYQEEEQPISPLDLNSTAEKRETSETCPFCSTSWTYFSEIEKAGHMLSHSAPSLLDGAVPVLQKEEGRGVGARRRESMYVQRTLGSYHFYANVKLAGKRGGWKGVERKRGELQRVDSKIGGVLERRGSLVCGFGDLQNQSREGEDTGLGEDDEICGREGARKRIRLS